MSVIRSDQQRPEPDLRHFWRVEENDGLTVVYTSELDPAGPSYTPTGIFHDWMELTAPFDIEGDLQGIADL